MQVLALAAVLVQASADPVVPAVTAAAGPISLWQAPRTRPSWMKLWRQCRVW